MASLSSHLIYNLDLVFSDPFQIFTSDTRRRGSDHVVCLDSDSCVLLVVTMTGDNCCVVGCAATKDKCCGLSFYSLPKKGNGLSHSEKILKK